MKDYTKQTKLMRDAWHVFNGRTVFKRKLKETGNKKSIMWASTERCFSLCVTICTISY